MFDHIVFNEESLPFETVEEFESGLNVFFQVLHETLLCKVSFSTVAEDSRGWASLSFGPGFSFGHWLNNSLEKEQIRQVNSVMNSIPCPSFITRPSLTILDDEALFVLESDTDREVKGLGLASLNNCSGLSFLSEDVWRSDEVKITKQWDENAVVVEENIKVPNIASVQHMKNFLKELQTQNQSSRSYFDNIKVSGNIDFPNLLFTESVLKVLRSNSVSSANYTHIIQTFNKLNSMITSSNNVTELASNTGLSISGESESTMSSKLLTRLRSFKHPDGDVRVFEEHIKNFSDSRRMHILADYPSNNICIGYFGPHIKTSSS